MTHDQNAPDLGVHRSQQQRALHFVLPRDGYERIRRRLITPEILVTRGFGARLLLPHGFPFA
jgi:hypothetical protein